MPRPATGKTLAVLAGCAAIAALCLWAATTSRRPSTRPTTTTAIAPTSPATTAIASTNQPTTRATPTVTVDGELLYMDEEVNQPLPPHLRIGWCEGKVATLYLLRYDDGRVAEKVKIGDGEGFLGDVDGDGSDELVLTGTPIRGKSLRIKRIYVFAVRTLPDGSRYCLGTAGGTTHVYRLAPGQSLAEVEITNPGGGDGVRGTGYGRAGIPDGQEHNTASIDVTYNPCWTDLFGTGQPVMCELATHHETTYAPDKKVLSNETWRELDGCWHYDAGRKVFVKQTVSVRLPDKSSDEELTGLLRGTTRPAANSAPATRAADW